MKVELEVGAKADMSSVVSELGAAGDAAKRMGDDIAAGTSQADAAASRMDSVADASDNMASRSAQAAGGLGDLGGAISGMGGPLGALGTGMEAAAPAIMGVTGASDLLNLATTSNIVTTVRAKVATVAHTVATKTMTVAQKALNLAMRANPIGIVITLVLALVAGLVLAYKRSETFRRIIDTAMKVARTAIGWVVDKVADLVGWLRDKLGPGATRVKDMVVSGFRAMLDPIGFVIDKVKAVIGWFGDAIAKTRAAIGLGKEYGSTMGNIFGDVFAGLEAVADQLRENAAVADRTQGGASGGGVGAPRMAAGGPTVNLTFTGVVGDPDAVARQVETLLRGRARQTGGRLVIS